MCVYVVLYMCVCARVCVCVCVCVCVGTAVFLAIFYYMTVLDQRIDKDWERYQNSTRMQVWNCAHSKSRYLQSNSVMHGWFH